MIPFARCARNDDCVLRRSRNIDTITVEKVGDSMNEDLKEAMEDHAENEEYERSGEILETVELTVAVPQAGTLITCSDPSGIDQTPVPEIISGSDHYDIERIRINGSERPEAYWKTYNTLEYYSDVRFEAGKSYTVFGKVKACPGYIFNDPVNLIVNGEEVPSEQVEDYSLEGDSFTFYSDITVR